MYESAEDELLAIKGELWMCADSEKPYKVGAGRGSKNYVCIEEDRFYVYSTRSSQSRLIKEVAFRSMKRVAWFTHNPKPPVSGGHYGVSPPHPPPRRGHGVAAPQTQQYYYMVLEFIRDYTVEESENLAKRERVVLCTENAQDFQIWQQFVESYKCTREPPTAELLQGRSRKKATAAAEYDHDETTTEEEKDRVAELMNALRLWKHRALQLLNETSQAVDSPTSSGTSGSFGVDHVDANTWKTRVDALLGKMKKHVERDPVGSDISHSGKESARLVELWNDVYERHVPNSSPRVYDGDNHRVEEQQRRRVQHIEDILSKSKLPFTVLPVPQKVTNACHVDGLEKTCLAIVSHYESTKGPIEKSVIREVDDSDDMTLPDKIRHVYETLRQGEENVSQKEDAEDMLAELRAARRALDDSSSTPQAAIHHVRQGKTIERVAKEALLCFTETAVELFQVCYEEYASIRDHILSAMRGSNVGGDKIAITSEHFEVVKALEEERRAAKTKQEALEKIMEELEYVRRDRDMEIGMLEQNFSRAKDGWVNDLSVLQTKLTALQSSMTRTAVVLPDEKATLVSPRQALYGDAKETPDFAPEKNTEDTDDSIRRWATQLVCNGEELPGSIVATRLQRFFFWALKSVVPLCAGRDTNCILELVIWAMQNHLALLQTAARVFGSQAIGAESDERTDLCTSLQALYDNHVQLEQIIEHYAGVACPSNVKGNADFTEVSNRLRTLKDNEANLQNIHTILETTNENVEEYILQLISSHKQLQTIRKIAGEPSDIVQGIIHQQQLIQQLQNALRQLLDNEKHMHLSTEELLNQIPSLYGVQKELQHTKHLLQQTAQLVDTMATQLTVQQEELEERIEHTHEYYQQHPIRIQTWSVITETAIAELIECSPNAITKKIREILEELKLCKSILGEEKVNTQSLKKDHKLTRAQCLHGIESALAALGVEESEEPAAAAIMRAAEEARAREEELHDRLDESAARGRALESKLSELTRVADSLQRALDGSVLAVEDEEDASAAGDRAVEALKRLCEDSVTVSAVMGGAMQRKLEDAEAEPLLQQCRKMASDMEALRRSEQRYRALVGDDDAGDRCADREDPSTRAQCLHGIESALAALGVEESEEPAAAAIMRAAEEARAREEELHDRLDESAARGRALESKLSELTRAADTLQRALDGSVLAVGDEEDASAAGDRAVEALKRLCEDSVTASAAMGGAMQRKLDDAEAEPLLQQCRQMASDMEALRRSERCCVVNLFNQRALVLSSLLVLEELDDRISLLSELSFFPSILWKIFVSNFSSVSGICALLRCDAGSIVHQVEELLESRDYYCRLVGGGDFILETDDDDVTRAECVHAIRRAVSRLAPAILDDLTLRLPEKLQGAVQGIMRDISHIRASLEEALDSAGRAEKDLQTIVSASERALLMLRGVDSSSEAVDGVVVARPSVSFLSRSLLSQAGEITGRLRDLNDVCVECNAIVGQALKRECEQLQVGAEGSLSSTAPIEPDFLLLVDHCRELVAEVFTLREQRRSSLAAMERNVGDHEVLLGAVRGSVNALLFALDNAASVASQGEEDGDSSESVANLCVRLGSCTRAVTRLLREKEHAASASAKLLQEALLPEEDRRSSDNDGLFSLASDVVRALEARRVELDSMGKALEQSRHFAEEYRRRMDKNFAEQDAAMTAQVQTHAVMEGQLKEATERQLQATASAAKLLRDLSEFAGSVAAITLYGGDVKVDEGERSEDARGAHKKDVVTYEVSRERLEGILENCSTVMRTLEAAKAKAKSLSSEAEDLRGRLRESENTSRELEYHSRHAETKAAARVAAMTEEMNFLRNALQAKVTECERIQQQVQDTERRVDRLQAEMADNTKTFGSERDTLSKVHSLLLLENEEMRRQLEGLRTEQKELQNFLRGCQVTSLDDAAMKMVAFAGDVLLNSLALEEAENRVQLLQNWALSYGVHTAPLLGICTRVANAISASEFEEIPMRVAEMLKREQEFGRLLGVPAKTVGPTRAALLKMVTDWAEKIGVEQQPDAGTFLTELDFALSDLHSGYASLKNKIAAIQNELYQALSALETGGKQAEQITALLRSAHPTEELTVTTATAGEMSPSGILQVALASLRLEVEWAVEKIVSNTEQTRRTLEVLEPVCSGRSVLEVCLHAAEELQERRSTEEVLRAELTNVQAKAESYRGCIEASMRCLPDSLIHVKAGDDLQRRCASASAELRRRMEVVSSAQRIIALGGHDNHSGDLCMNVDDMLRKLRQLKEREKMLEANYESSQQRALKLEETLRATEERLEETITFQVEKERNAIMQEKEKQNLLQAQLSESVHEREKLRTTLAACASAIGCSLEGGSGGNDAANHNNKNGDDKEVADLLRAVKALASAHDASVNELEELREQHALSRKALASVNDIRALAQEEQCRLMEEVERLRAEIIVVTASNEEHRAALLHLTEQAEGVVLRISTAHSPSSFLSSSTLTKRAPLVAQCLLDACNIFEENRCALEDELSALKRLYEERQHEMKAVNEVLCEALELTGETNPSDTMQLGAIVKEKLSKALKEKNAIADVTEALQSENAMLKASCTSTQAKLEETTTALEQVDTQKRALQEELRAFAAFAENVAETVGEPLPSGSTDLERLKVACAAHQASLQHHAEELTRVREELDVASSSSAVMRATIDENAAERERLTEQLLGAEQEREALLKASEQLVERVQSILDDHVEVQRELTFAGGDDDVTVVDIVQACVEQLDKNRIGAETSNEQLAALQRENAMLMKEIQRLQNSAAVKSGEVTELHEQLRILLESRQVAQADQSKLQAEHDSLSRQVQALFTDALHMAADEMRLQLPMFTDTSASGALQGLRSLFDYIAEKFRSGAHLSDDTEDKIESLKQLLQLQERQNAKENKILYRTFCDHVVVYTGTNYSRREDGDEDSGSGKPHRLTTDFLVAVGETLHGVHTEFRHAGRLFHRLMGGPVEPSSSLRGMTLPELAAWLGEAASETVERSELLHNAIRAVSQIVEILPIDLASSQEQVTEWVESFSLWLERAQRGVDSSDRLLEALTSVVHSHGGTVEETLSTNTTITSFNNYNNNSSSNHHHHHHHHLDIVDTSLQDLNNSRTDMSFSRYITDPHHRAVFNAVRDLLSQLEGRGRVLTSEWQALMDQNNRLIHERRQAEEEQARVEDHVQELRRVVQRKIEEDRRVEQSLKELDRHLDMQARELAMKYRSDHDIIVRQFTELRGTIRRTIKPPRSHSTAATTFGSASHRTL